MKTITLTAQEFYEFRELANKLKIWFDIHIVQGFIHVEADAKLLEKLGY